MNGGYKPDWTVDLIDTGMETMTGGRIKRLAPYVGNETFMLTWGDGVSDVDLKKLLAFHRSHGKLCHVDGRSSAGPLRLYGLRRRSRRGVQGKAADPRRLDQRRVLRL